ncbi:MAG: methyltransferase domain-containing protein [Pirellulales bacterium]|nr:methyltransferase domain-containing protein [Pirellulales bacterium]
MVQVQTVSHTYEPFSKEPEYIEANRAFIDRLPLTEAIREQVHRVLDVACGTGAVSQLLAAQVPRAHLYGVDIDPEQIRLSTQLWHELGYEVRSGFELTDDCVANKPVVTLALASGEDLRFPRDSFDCVTIANAIHMLPDRRAFLSAAARVLKPGGIFGMNTGFYAGCYPPGTERHTVDWLRAALAFVGEENQRREANGEPLIKRRHGTSRGAFQNRWLSAEEWCAELRAAGLEPIDVHERMVMMDARCLAALAAYGGLVEAVMSGYPVEEASRALQSTAARALELQGVETLPRLWLEIWARKP